MPLIHVLMLSRAIEPQVTVEELCDIVRQLWRESPRDQQSVDDRAAAGADSPSLEDLATPSQVEFL